MNLTERERTILQLAKQGLSDYRIARRMSMDLPNVTRAKRNAQKKLLSAVIALKWASKMELNISQFNLGNIDGSAANSYNFFSDFVKQYLSEKRSANKPPGIFGFKNL